MKYYSKMMQEREPNVLSWKFFESGQNKITLIDWRESFGDDTDIGDLYYDLGKLYHGLLINGKMVKDKKFSLQIENTKVTLS